LRTATFFLFLGTWLVFMPFHPGHPLTVDSVVTLDTVRAMSQGTLSIPKAMVTREGRNGRQYSLYGPLLPLLSLPAYKVVSMMESHPSQPGSPFITWADYTALGINQWICALLVALVFETALAWGLPVSWALGVSVAVATSTMILPYSRDYFSQPLAALCVFGAFLSLRHSVSNHSRVKMTLSSLWMGAAVLTRMDMLVLVPGFLFSGLLALRKTCLGISFRGVCLLIIPFLVCLMGLLVFDWYRWGTWFSTPYQRMPFTTPLIDSLPRFFYSRDLSLFLFNPLLLPSLVFLVLTWRESRWLWSGILIGGLCYFIVVASYVDFHGGICPGPRYLLVLVPVFLLPLLAGLGKPNWRTPLIGAVLVTCWIVGLMMNGYAAWVDYSQSLPAWDFWRGLVSS
jgi:hypothetical protein